VKEKITHDIPPQGWREVSLSVGVNAGEWKETESSKKNIHF